MRFGDTMLAAGHTAIPNLALDHYAKLDLSPAEMLFVIHVWQYWWTERNPYPSLSGIAERMAVSRRQVRTYVSKLKTRGLLTVRERTSPGHGQISSEYDFAPFLAAIVRLAGGENSGGADHPRKFSSEGPRKDPSSEEDKGKEDSALASNSAREGGSNARSEGNADLLAEPAVEAVSQAGPLARLLQARRPVEPRPRRSWPTRRPRVAAQSATPRLDFAVQEVLEGLGDAVHLRSNLAQARTLLLSSSLTEDGFAEAVYRAHALVRERLRVGTAAVERPGAYFFTVLRDLFADRLGDRPTPDVASPRPSTPSSASRQDAIRGPAAGRGAIDVPGVVHRHGDGHSGGPGGPSKEVSGLGWPTRYSSITK